MIININKGDLIINNTNEVWHVLYIHPGDSFFTPFIRCELWDSRAKYEHSFDAGDMEDFRILPRS
jgi:hypothetical protein